MEKKLYYLLSDNADLSVTVCDLRTAADIIDSEMQSISKEEQEQTRYKLTPKFYTDEEYEKLPEWDG